MLLVWILLTPVKLSLSELVPLDSVGRCSKTLLWSTSKFRLSMDARNEYSTGIFLAPSDDVRTLITCFTKIGCSLGGLTRRFLVKPPSMIWPSNLVNCALFNTLHSTEYTGIGNRSGISREKFFLFAFLASAAWYLFPGYLFTALSYFSWVCWIAPDNVVVNQLFGYISGAGMSVITFDWAQVAYIGSPLACPWWVIANIGSSFVFFYCTF